MMIVIAFIFSKIEIKRKARKGNCVPQPRIVREEEIMVPSSNSENKRLRPSC